MPKSDISHLPRRSFFASAPKPIVATLKTVEKRAAAAEVIEPTPAKRGRGRPKAEGERPWEAEGLSRAQWYRRKAKEGV